MSESVLYTVLLIVKSLGIQSRAEPIASVLTTARVVHERPSVRPRKVLDAVQRFHLQPTKIIVKRSVLSDGAFQVDRPSVLDTRMNKLHEPLSRKR